MTFFLAETPYHSLRIENFESHQRSAASIVPIPRNSLDEAVMPSYDQLISTMPLSDACATFRCVASIWASAAKP
jgi:hypothetical protein